MNQNSRNTTLSLADLGVKCYAATKHSGLVRSTLSRGKGVNVAAKNFHLLNDFLKETRDPAQGALVTK